jgi:predicted Zn-dependent protease
MRAGILFFAWIAACGFVCSAAAQTAHPTPAPNPPPPMPRPNQSTFDQTRLAIESNSRNAALKSEIEDNCFLPPLSTMRITTVAVTQVQLPAKARKEYEQACAAIKNKKASVAEEHLRRAVQQHATYSAAWVTLGQVLLAEQKAVEADQACSEASKVDSKYAPAYLCRADVAARSAQWEQVRKMSQSALEIDSVTNHVAYAMNAAASLSLHNIAEAEKNALRAAEIDKANSDPRVHFLLAQIYEAKGDASNEAAQLREYLKFATDPDDVAMVKQYLTEVEKRTAGK